MSSLSSIRACVALGPPSQLDPPFRADRHRQRDARNQEDFFLPPLLPPLASPPAAPPPAAAPGFLVPLAAASAVGSGRAAAGDSGRGAAGKLLRPCAAAQAHTCTSTPTHKHARAHTHTRSPAPSAWERAIACRRSARARVRIGVRCARMRACMFHCARARTPATAVRACACDHTRCKGLLRLIKSDFVLPQRGRGNNLALITATHKTASRSPPASPYTHAQCV